MHSVCRCSIPVRRRSFFKQGPPWHIFAPTPDQPLSKSGRKTTTLVRDHEHFIPTKFHQNSSSGSGEAVENVKVYGRTDDGRCAMTIAYLSLRPRWAKNVVVKFYFKLRFIWIFISYCVLSTFFKTRNAVCNVLQTALQFNAVCNLLQIA